MSKKQQTMRRHAKRLRETMKGSIAPSPRTVRRLQVIFESVQPFTARVKHDGGEARIAVYGASNAEGAALVIMEAEGCPRSAIVDIQPEAGR